MELAALLLSRLQFAFTIGLADPADRAPPNPATQVSQILR